MAVMRTYEVILTPAELADRFASMFNEEQAAFFNAVGDIAAGWPGGSFCGQAFAIFDCGKLTPAGMSVLRKLADHLAAHVDG